MVKRGDIMSSILDHKRYHTKERKTIQRVSKELDIPTGTIRQWEKDFNFKIGRDEVLGTRIYSDKDIEIIKRIKFHRSKNFNKGLIREILIEEGLIKNSLKGEVEMTLSDYSTKELISELVNLDRFVYGSEEELSALKSAIVYIEKLRQANEELKQTLSALSD